MCRGFTVVKWYVVPYDLNIHGNNVVHSNVHRRIPWCYHTTCSKHGTFLNFDVRHSSVNPSGLVEQAKFGSAARCRCSPRGIHEAVVRVLEAGGGVLLYEICSGSVVQSWRPGRRWIAALPANNRRQTNSSRLQPLHCALLSRNII